MTVGASNDSKIKMAKIVSIEEIEFKLGDHYSIIPQC
jgi:hypothetical protein